VEECLDIVLKNGFAVFAFDFSGYLFFIFLMNIIIFIFYRSGMSEGEYVSMGFYEKYDLKAVVEYLNTIKYINKF